MGVLSNFSAFPGGKPFEPFGKDSICSEGGSTGRRTDWPCRIKFAEKEKLLRPSVQLPAGIHGCAVYKDFARDGKRSWQSFGRFEGFWARGLEGILQGRGGLGARNCTHKT